MKKEKKVKEEKPVEVNDGGIVKGSVTKEEFKKFIEKYRLQNPVKYEWTKGELEKHLATL